MNGLGAIINSGSQQTQALQFVTLTGPTTLSVMNRWDIRNNSAATVNMNGFTLTKVGSAMLDLNAVTFTSPGPINVDAGVLGSGIG